MKKVALSLMAFALVGASAFAQAAAAPAAPVVTIGDWGRQIFAIGNTNSDKGEGHDIYGTLGTSWGGNPRITGLQITAHNDNAGFAISPSADNGVFGLTDENKAWISPLAGLTFESGINLETDTWRDTADYGAWDWVRLPGMHGDSWTFFRLGEGGGAFQSDVNYNKDGIGAWILIDQGISSTKVTDASGNSISQTGSAVPLNNAGEVGPRMQIGAAYAIPSIGTVKAQVLGSNVTGTNDFSNVSQVVTGAGSNSVAAYANIQGAFDFTAVPNLLVTLGLQGPTNASAAGYVIQTKDYAQYKMDKATIHARINVADYNGDNVYSNYQLNNPQVTGTDIPDQSPKTTGTQTKADSGVGFEGGFGVDYDLGSMVTISGNLDYINAIQEKAVNGSEDEAGSSGDNATTAVGVFLTKGFSNGAIGIGFQYSTTTFAGAGVPTTDQSTGHWVVPIMLTESF